MTRKELDAFRTRLEAMVAHLASEREQLHKEVLGDERDPAVSITQEQFADDDISREKSDEEVAQAVLGTEEEMLEECQAALGRIDAGTFGKCLECGKPIPKPRLEAVPYARFCIRCARTDEAA